MRALPASPSALRSLMTWFWMVTRADGGGSAPHSALASSSKETVRPGFSSSAASTARCFPFGTGTARPPTRTANGPSKQNSASVTANRLPLTPKVPITKDNRMATGR